MRDARISTVLWMTRGWWATALLSLALLGRLAVLDRELAMPGADFGILSLQFTNSPATLERIRALWIERGVLALAFESLRTDFLFIAAYVGNFILGCLLLAWTRPLGRVMVGAAIGIAVLDAAENLLQMHVLAHGASTRLAAFNSICVAGKFLLVGIVITFLLMAWTRRKRALPAGR